MIPFRELLEGKHDYKINHKSYSLTADEIEKFVKKNGYTFDDESDTENIGAQMFDVLGMGPPKPKAGKTNRLHFKLYKNNKIQKKQLHAQIYGNDGFKPLQYELNMYIS